MRDSRSSVWGGLLKSRAGMVLLAFLAAAGFLLVYEHRVHIFAGDGALFALVAVCLGMHVFMHRGHGGGDGDGGDGGKGDDREGDAK